MKQTVNRGIQTLGYTITALIAFAANSVLCRLALKSNAIDPASFTVLRLISGIFMFMILFSFKTKTAKDSDDRKGDNKNTAHWKTAFILFTYAVTFSFAYVSLDTGTGALILFGAVQLTMIAANIFSGNKLQLTEWLGVLISFSGLAYLVSPTLALPSFTGALLMGLSGIAWGIYTLIGRSSTDPMRDTALNFKYTAPLALILILIAFPVLNISLYGVVLAVISGALASALGYTIWFVALSGLSKIEAAVVQLTVPVIAAIGGVLFISEAISMRLVIACILILGGISMVLMNRLKFAKSDT